MMDKKSARPHDRVADPIRAAEAEAYFQVAVMTRDGDRTMGDTISEMRFAGRTWREVRDHLVRTQVKTKSR